MKTERLYYTDSNLRAFEARIASLEPCQQGFRAVLDRTAFYPESGGQPSDRGKLSGAQVLDVIDDGEAVIHVLDRPPEGETVRGEVDWPRRFDHMQQHTGQHILSAAFEHTCQARTLSFHMGRAASTIDLESARLSPAQLAAAEELANQVVCENRSVEVLFHSSEQASQMALRKPSERQGELRLIQVADFDLSACGGTHVRQTGAVGQISIRGTEKFKGGTRVEFVCGGRALRAARGDFQLLSQTAQSLSCALEKTPETVAKLAETVRTQAKTVEKLTRDLLAAEARILYDAAEERGGVRLIRRVLESENAAQARILAQAIASLPGAIAMIGARVNPAGIILAQAQDGSADMASILRQALAQVGGKSGGARNYAQGGGMPESRLEEALQIAERLLRGGHGSL